ncbi:hypothetical protein TeGR_g845, partial [Tetraparma gracilis]
MTDPSSPPPDLFNALASAIASLSRERPPHAAAAQSFLSQLLAASSLTAKQHASIGAALAELSLLRTTAPHHEQLTRASHLASLPAPPRRAGSFLRALVASEFESSSQTVAASRRLLAHLSAALGKTTLGCSCVVYGSSLAELATRSSDVDVSIRVRELELAKAAFGAGRIGKADLERVQKNAVYQVKRDLERSRAFEQITAVPFARIPVVKCVDARAGNPFSAGGEMHADVCFGNDIAVRNSFLLREYASEDGRARELMMLVK